MLILVKKVALVLGLVEEVDQVLAREEVVEGQKKIFVMKNMMEGKMYNSSSIVLHYTTSSRPSHPLTSADIFPFRLHVKVWSPPSVI